jgi:hypothetical protein
MPTRTRISDKRMPARGGQGSAYHVGMGSVSFMGRVDVVNVLERPQQVTVVSGRFGSRLCVTGTEIGLVLAGEQLNWARRRKV